MMGPWEMFNWVWIWVVAPVIALWVLWCLGWSLGHLAVFRKKYAGCPRVKYECGCGHRWVEYYDEFDTAYFSAECPKCKRDSEWTEMHQGKKSGDHCYLVKENFSAEDN